MRFIHLFIFSFNFINGIVIFGNCCYLSLCLLLILQIKINTEILISIKLYNINGSLIKDVFTGKIDSEKIHLI